MAPKRGKNNKRGGKAAPNSPRATRSSKVTKPPKTPSKKSPRVVVKTPKTSKAPASSNTPAPSKTQKSSEPKKTSENDQHDVLEVNWAVPKARRREAPDQQHIDDYARVLYNREPDELQPVQTALPLAQIRAPIYQKKGGKDMEEGDANRSSAALRSLYNNVKDRSVNEPDGHHNLAALTQNFEEGGGDIAVILSNAEDEEVLVLDQDRRLQVIVNDETAHIDFIRRLSADNQVYTLGFFIQLPQGISVTVNGVTYTNDGSASPTPFYIGPLQGYAVIELLSQPAFFFRNEGSLKYSITTRRVSEDELARRDRNGDASADDVTVRWLAIGAVEQEDGGASDIVNVQAEQPQVVRDEPMEEHLPTGDEPPEEHRPVAGEPPEEHHPVEDEPMEEDRPEEVEYSDAFTDDGQPIEDPCNYVQKGLKRHTSNRIASILPRVIASINRRQAENVGFSFVHNDTVFRPGRTLVTALTDCGRYLLVVGQIQPDTSIRIRALYPRTWRSARNHRDKINNDVRDWFMRTDWLRHTFDSHEQMVARLPKDIEWVPCAQTPTQEGTFTYTILNAWALVLGLEPDPTFTPSHHGNEAFFIKAERIFDLALSDSLTWKILLAFLRCTGFVKLAATVEDENNEDAYLPATNRRFDQRKRSFEALIADQTRADQASAGKNLNPEQLAVHLEKGILHSAAFAADSFTEEMRDMLTQLVRAGEWRLQDTVQQFTKKLEKLAEGSESSSTAGSPPDITLTESPESDALAVPKNFDPCGHLDNFVSQEELFHQHAKEETPQAAEIPRLPEKDIQDSIAAVVRAVNRRHPPGAGFTTEASTTTVHSAVDGNEDSISVFLYEEGDDHELCVMVHNPADGVRSCTIIDSQPLATNQNARSKVRKQLRNEISAVGPIPWISGPQQAHKHHSGYHVVLNAWSIVLGLPLNIQRFKPSPKFIHDAYLIIQAVLQDEVSWLDIWALLRCHNYVTSAEAPALERRFAKTMPSSEHRAYVSEMKSKKNRAATDPNINVYDYFQSDSIREFGVNIDWDESYPEDGIAGFSELQPSDITDSMVSPGGNQQEQGQPTQNDVFARDGITGFSELQPSDFGESMVSFSEIQQDRAEKFEPCKYLRDTLKTLLADKRVQKELKVLWEGGVTRRKGEWLHDEEVALSVDAVLMAINQVQGMEEGFSVVPSHTIATAVAFEGALEEGLVGPALRPGRPFIAPFVYKSHIILLVAQFDAEGRPTISILDSLPAHYERKYRRQIHHIAWELLLHTSWWRNFFPNRGSFDGVKPDTATWVRGALQQSSNECGYFAVLNAWGLALGLELNPDVKLKWTDELFQQVVAVLHLARIGRADWKLIFALLRCHGLVRDGVVPENRRFARTYEAKTAAEFNEALDKECKTEETYWMDRKYDDERLKPIRNCNRVPNMIGTPHTSKFSSDRWDRGGKFYEYLARLSRFHKFDPNDDGKRMRQKSSNLPKQRLQNCMKKLKSATPSREDLVEAILEDVNRQYEGMDSTLLSASGDWVDDTIAFYDEIMLDVKAQKILGRPTISDTWKRMLWDSELNLIMASVLEAIDALQSDLHARAHPHAPFAGGFSLTTSTHLQLALNEDIGDENQVLSRPRRAWLFPLVLQREEGLLPKLRQWAAKHHKSWKPQDITGHSLLVLMQEMCSGESDSDDPIIETHLLDSRVHIFGEVAAWFGDQLEYAARRLGWAMHRQDKEPFPHFENGDLYLRDEIPQQVEYWACGHHVFINAWMLAMGLHVNQHAEFTKDIYFQAYTLVHAAVGGFLDWKTLVLWLFSHKLTRERDFSEVPMDRRFRHTFRQTNENDLAARIEQYKVVDDILGRYDQYVYPYDYSNNIIFDDDEPKDGSEDAEQSAANGEPGLERSVDDADLDFLGPRGTKRKLRGDSDDGLDFLDRYEISREDIKKIAANCSSAWKKRRMFDNLSFLEVH